MPRGRRRWISIELPPGCSEAISVLKNSRDCSWRNSTLASILESSRTNLATAKEQRDELEREREVQIAGIQARRDDLLKSCSLAMRRALFGPKTFGLDPIGAEASVQKVSVADLKAFHQKLAVPSNCVLAIYGDVKTADVKAAVEKVGGVV